MDCFSSHHSLMPHGGGSHSRRVLTLQSSDYYSDKLIQVFSIARTANYANDFSYKVIFFSCLFKEKVTVVTLRFDALYHVIIMIAKLGAVFFVCTTYLAPCRPRGKTP